MTDPLRWTNQEVLDQMDAFKGGKSPLNKARQVFSSACAQIEQAGAQRTPLNPIQMRRMEFAAVLKIIAAYNGSA